MLAVCGELSKGVVSGIMESDGVKFGCCLAWQKFSYMIERQLKQYLVSIKSDVERRLWGCTRYLYRQRLSPPIQERRESEAQ